MSRSSWGRLKNGLGVVDAIVYAYSTRRVFVVVVILPVSWEYGRQKGRELGWISRDTYSHYLQRLRQVFISNNVAMNGTHGTRTADVKLTPHACPAIRGTSIDISECCRRNQNIVYMGMWSRRSRICGDCSWSTKCSHLVKLPSTCRYNTRKCQAMLFEVRSGCA